jgi:short-subunit dehydrogenase
MTAETQTTTESAPVARRAALVTGASSGIGSAAAEMLARSGHDITIVARRQAELEALAQRLAPTGRRVEVAAVDLSDDGAPAAIVDAHTRAHGRLDILVNGAGVGLPEPLPLLSARKLDLHLQINLRAPALLCQAASALLIAAGEEHGNALVVNIASVVGKQGVAKFAAYSASKAAMIALSEVINAELGPRGVKATAICPALVDTPMTAWTKSQGAAAPPLMDIADVVSVVRMLLELSPSCVVPEITLTAPGGDLLRGIRS